MKYIIRMCAISLVLLPSCSKNARYIKEAEETTEKFYMMLTRNRIDSMVPLFSQKFYKKNDTTHLIKFLRELPDSLGPIATYQLIESKLRYEVSNKNSEKSITVTYKVIYDPDKYTAKEMFVFYFDGDFSGKIDKFVTTGWVDE